MQIPENEMYYAIAVPQRFLPLQAATCRQHIWPARSMKRPDSGMATM